MSDEYSVELAGGKYTVRHTNGSNFYALRYHETWRDLTGDGLVLALVQRIEELEAKRIEADERAVPVDAQLWCARLRGMHTQKDCDDAARFIETIATRPHSPDAADGARVGDAVMKRALEASRAVQVQTGALAKPKDEQRLRAALEAALAAQGQEGPDGEDGPWAEGWEERSGRSASPASSAGVPDARALHVLKAAKDEPQFDPEDFTSVDTRLYFWRVGWNACREAMLASAPSATPEGGEVGS